MRSDLSVLVTESQTIAVLIRCNSRIWTGDFGLRSSACKGHSKDGHVRSKSLYEPCRGEVGIVIGDRAETRYESSRRDKVP